MNKRETHIVTGMTRDLATSRFEPAYVYDAHNIRIRVVDNNSTLLSVTNEKGTEEFELTGSITEIKGTIIGSAAFTNTLVLFTTDTGAKEDYIYRVDFDSAFDTASISYLFDGAYCHSHGIEGLDFSVLHPIEALAVYENENIQKVYWVDGINQPRMINICKGNQSDNPDKFNFNREIGADAKMVVTKYNSGGEFRPGTVQYCFNYFDKFGQESNIVDVSPLYYISPKDSGLAADDVSGCSFKITFSNLNTKFEFIRLYAIYRSSENATPSVRIVGDYSVGDSQVMVWTLDNFTHPDTPVEHPNIDVPFENLWVIDSNHNLKYNVNQRYGPESGSATHEIPLAADEYLYDDRTDTAYCVYYFGRDGEIGLPKRDTVIIGTHGGTDFYYIVNEYIPIDHRCLVSTVFTQEAISQNISVVDTGTYGSTLDAEALLFIGGQYIVAETLADKDNTLFLGNLKNVVPNIGNIEIDTSGVSIALKDLHDYVRSDGLATVNSQAFGYTGEKLETFEPENEIVDPTSYDILSYDKDNNRDSTAIKVFKTRENYRLGFIAQYKTGQWSEAIWLGDFTEEEMNGVNHFFPSTDFESGGVTFSLTLWGQQFRGAGFSSNISSLVIDALIQNGFIKIAPVVVYPQFSDRLVICQGLLCPSVFNISDRTENSPFSQCDWRFRKGYSWSRIGDEIQLNATEGIVQNPATIMYSPEVPFAYYKSTDDVSYSDMDSTTFSRFFGTEYYLDPSILTFHSPDIDSSEELIEDDFLPLKLRLVGYSNGGFFSKRFTHPNPDNPSIIVPDDWMTTREVERESAIHYYTELETLGFGTKSELLIPNTTVRTPGQLFEYWSNTDSKLKSYTEKFGGPLKNVGFKDRLHLGNGETEDTASYYGWFTYLWHRNGSLNGQFDSSQVDYGVTGVYPRTAMYKRKCVSEKTYGKTTYFLNPNDEILPVCIDVPVKGIKLYDDDYQVVFTDTQFNGESLYYGNSNKVIIPTFVNAKGMSFYDITESSTDAHSGRNNVGAGYPVRTAGYYSTDDSQYYQDGTLVASDLTHYGIDPVQLKYNTTRHAIVSLQNEDDSTILQLGDANINSAYIFWLNSNKDFLGIGLNSGFYEEGQTQHIDYTFLNNCMYIGELYRDMSQEQLASRFGGTSQEALTSNVWVLAGEPIRLESITDVELLFKEGDTYFGRYDCLKSYPTTQEDRQSIVSIYSTEIESRVNLDFRYGNTMNLDDNTLVTPQNFNLYNHGGYEQTNQYFTFKAIDYDRYLDQSFPNMITWSKEKTLGEDIDTWTSIPMLSTLDLDGTKGEITKLVRFNNEIIAFQDNAFAQILFNSRVQIPVSDGVPVEITNGYKVDGKRYISESIGMSNKWSMAVSPYALYFADDSKNSLYAYNGQLTDLSSSKGMKTWMYDKGNDFRPVWNPRDYGNLRTFYDKIYGDVYFTTANTSLVYSEQIGNFTSFMDYGGVTSMNNMGNKFLSFTTSDNDNSKMWEMWEGDYNMFFDEFKPYWMTFIANENPTKDKIFNNLEWRSVVYDKDGNYLPYSTFDTMRIWHEHQDTGCINLKDNIGIPSSLKKKFNAFRTYIPRDVKGEWSPPNMQRIRNPWTYIRLAKIEENTDQMIFTDLNIDSFE